MTTSQISFLKMLLGVILVSVISFIADANHLTGILPPTIATIIAAIAAAYETSLREKNGTALFGAVSIKR